MKILALFGLLLFVAGKVPIIGILSKRYDQGNYTFKTDKKQTIDGSYVHYLEGAGAKVAYINHNASEQYIRDLFPKLNGIFFSGGTVYGLTPDGNFTNYTKTVKLLLELAMKAYDDGDYVPVWGTCLGFQLGLIAIATKPLKVLKGGCDCSYYNINLDFTQRAQNSRLFSMYSAEQLYTLGKENITYHNHVGHVDTKHFYDDEQLSSLFNVLATSKNIPGNLTYISAVEGKKYPFYFVQFHPEKGSYYFDVKREIIRSKPVLEIMQQMALFFVEESRKNNHTFASIEEEIKHAVYTAEVAMDDDDGPVFIFP